VPSRSSGIAGTHAGKTSESIIRVRGEHVSFVLHSTCLEVKEAEAEIEIIRRGSWVDVVSCAR
jgi:hypothetical protein